MVKVTVAVTLLWTSL